jgi:hypothetical protein
MRALHQEPDEDLTAMTREALKGAFQFLERAVVIVEEIEGTLPGRKPPVDLESTEAAGHA